MKPLRAQQLAAELEVEMMAHMHNRMTIAYHRKCVPPLYKEAEMSKGKSVCLDWCLSKHLDIHKWIGKKLTELSV
ncbi:mitochondrial import inner membrane translocase subunit Tim10-like [Erinaceus europaeus]|uniref:Mitochondrial import inner membrane translocase subunit n=1 Tax=Erinaceus europaeus TaxID=9365 RepID=A0ABM3XKV7_ERIEU|nr:mitochondrial import inner membrane translocase subunit Tim10-like [Erinaceus europaeus]